MNQLSLILQNRDLILGRNERQLSYIRKYNLSRAKRIADNKVLSKQILKKSGIPVPKKVAVIRGRRELDSFNFDGLPSSFVVKPVKGTRGGGIEIFYNRDKNGNWIRADKSRMSLEDLKSHCQDILDGKYSLFNEPDIILIEERVKFHKNFKYYTYKGAPDIRVIVFNKIPIMSYVRLPTKESEGKANLDLGAIAVGIDIAVGKTTTSIIGKGTPIEYTPDTHLPLSGIKIPYWDKILHYAVEASIATKLGYAAIDFLIDREEGPVIVELNARPGLSIQIANHDGLRWRLKKAQGLKVKNTEHGVRLGKNLFGGEIEEELEEISGKQIIGLSQDVVLFSKDGAFVEQIKAKVDTGADSSSIDKELARRLGYESILNIPELNEIDVNSLTPEERLETEQRLSVNLKEKYPELEEVQFVKSASGITLRAYVKIRVQIEGLEFETRCSIINRSNMFFQAILGKNTLTRFLIDPSKK